MIQKVTVKSWKSYEQHTPKGNEKMKNRNSRKRIQGTRFCKHQPESIERCDAGGTGDDLQLCGKPDPDQPRGTGDQIRCCQSGDGYRTVYPGTDGSICGSDPRVLLVGFMFGNGVSILYSLAGGILSFLVMLLLKRIKGFSMIGVSIAGGVSHNIGQIAVAMCAGKYEAGVLPAGADDRGNDHRYSDRCGEPENPPGSQPGRGSGKKERITRRNVSDRYFSQKRRHGRGAAVRYIPEKKAEVSIFLIIG